MHTAVISKYLSRDGFNIFDEVVREIEYEFNKPVNNIQDMKDRANKKRKGDIWEEFCKDWLLASGDYTQVWLLNEYNTEFPHAFVSEQDNGIDLIGLTSMGWHAIQCKYRGKGLRVDWKSLSTFIAMCERTRSHNGFLWEKYIVMTNCVGVTHKLPRTPKDKNICRKDLQNTSRDHWLRMIGKDHGKKLGFSSFTSDNSPLTAEQPITYLTLNIISPLPNIDEIRRRRLQYYSTIE